MITLDALTVARSDRGPGFGFGAASRNVPRQLPELVRQFPELRTCYDGGTINVLFDIDVEVQMPDFASTPISWAPGVTETFDFVRVLLEAPSGVEPVMAWFYMPSGSPHRPHLKFKEMVTQRLVALPDHPFPCRVHIDREDVEWLAGRVILK